MPNEFRIGPVPDRLERGRMIQVPIVLHLENSIKARGIHARFHGGEETKATYTATTSDGKGGTRTETRTAVEIFTIVDESFLLAGSEEKGFFSNVADSLATMIGAGRSSVMEPGDYKYSVEVAMPDDAPPTHEAGKTRVFYELTVHADIPLRRDLKLVKSFDVVPLSAPETADPVRVCYPDDEGRGFFDRLFGPDVRIELALAKDSLRKGDSIDGVFQIETTKPLSARAVNATLLGIEKSTAHGHSDSFLHRGEKTPLATPGSIEGTFAERFTLTTESVADLPISARGNKFSIDWFVEIALDVPWAKDPTIRAPFVLLPGAVS